MTNFKQITKKKQFRAAKKHLNSNIKYPDFTWTDVGSEEYLNAIDDINDLYRKMLEIGKAAEVFHDKECPMMSAKTKKEFQKHRDSMRRNYRNYLNTPKSKLGHFRVDSEILPHPHKYGRGPTSRFPTNREIIAKERILTFEHYMASLNVLKCSVCLECEIRDKPLDNNPNYVCPTCTRRKDPTYYTDNNLHPVWYLIDDGGNYVLDENGNKAAQYNIPEELSCLSMYEKLLIRRCANFVPSVHLKNGVFGLKGHCVTFPQDITQMCDELPQQKDTLLTFIRNIGNKDTNAIFPTSLRVNRLKVLNALKWLKKHNPFYANITIKERNFDWMNGEKEVNMGTDGVILHMKESGRTKMKESEDEYVSKAHSTAYDDGDNSLAMRTVHANETNTVPTGRQSQQIKSLIDIAHKTNQSSKIMNFPPIDHDSAIS